jgi:hypothetical protein
MMVVMLFSVGAGENFEIPIDYLTACGITVVFWILLLLLWWFL